MLIGGDFLDDGIQIPNFTIAALHLWLIEKAFIK